MQHGRIEVAGIAGGDLDRRHSLRANALRVVLGRQVPFHDADPVLRPQPANGGLEQRGFARAGR